MFRNRRVAVVVPCYEVGDRAAHVVAALPAFVDHVIVVDDGSSVPVASAIERMAPAKTIVIRHETNRGLARAMETGYRKALELHADVVVKVDGDGQMDPAEMPRLLAPIVAGQADVAKGNRFLRRRHLAGMPLFRLCGNLVLSFLSKLATGYWNLFDPTNGYVAVRREALEEMDLARLGPGYFFEISLLCQACLLGAVGRDVSMPARYGDEKSSLSLRRASAMFPVYLLRAFVRRIALQHFIRDFTAVALLLLSGGTMLGTGLIYGTSVWRHSASVHQATPTGTIILVLMLVLAGFHLLVQAFVMDVGSVPTRSPWPSAEAGRSRPVPRRGRRYEAAVGGDVRLR
jgi:glycosyltransferase involved in cell wall biosynthesis